MNKSLSINCLILIIIPLFLGCGGRVKEENKNNELGISASLGHVSNERYSINTKESVVTWKGSMLLASEEEHVGYVYLSKGELMIEKGQLVGGNIEIDMNTIEYKDKLNKNTPIKHLKSPDYFDVEKFPVSTFSITRVVSAIGENINVTGNLTIKNITKAVTFPAKMEVKDGHLKASAKLVIDRTDWGIRYKSGKFYDIVADEIVSDDIEFLLEIVAKK